MIDNLIDHIQKAREEAYIREIQANTIIIDSDLAYMNHFYMYRPNGYSEVSASILGLKIEYADLKPLAVNFILLEKKEAKPKELEDYTREELLQELLRREEE